MVKVTDWGNMTNGNITNLEYVYCKQKHEVSHHNLTHCLRNLELSVEEESVFVQYTTHIVIRKEHYAGQHASTRHTVFHYSWWWLPLGITGKNSKDLYWQYHTAKSIPDCGFQGEKSWILWPTSLWQSNILDTHQVNTILFKAKILITHYEIDRS